MHNPVQTHNRLLSILWPEADEPRGTSALSASFPTPEPAPVPAPVYVYAQVTSSLDVVHELATIAELPPWSSVLVHSQTGGRGQLRRPWQSPEGNVYAALRLPAEKPFTEMACAPAVGCLLAHALRRMGLEVYVKWPNDLVLWQEQNVYKIGGILIEEHQHGIWAGIGINILHSPPKDVLRSEHAMLASHLQALFPSFLTSSEFHNPSLFWMRLVKEAFSWYEAGVFTHDTWCAMVNSMLLWRGSMVTLCTDDSSIHAKLLGISPTGAIRLEQYGLAEEFFCGSLRACGK